MKLIGVIEIQDRPAFVFEDGSIGLIVGLRDKDARDANTPPEPIVLIRPPLDIISEVPDNKRLALTRPRLFPQVSFPYQATGARKSTLIDDEV